MPASSAEGAGDLGMKRFENQLKIQQLESDALRMRLIDAESSSDIRRRALEQGMPTDTFEIVCVSSIAAFKRKLNTLDFTTFILAEY